MKNWDDETLESEKDSYLLLVSLQRYCSFVTIIMSQNATCFELKRAEWTLKERDQKSKYATEMTLSLSFVDIFNDVLLSKLSSYTFKDKSVELFINHYLLCVCFIRFII